MSFSKTHRHPSEARRNPRLQALFRHALVALVSAQLLSTGEFAEGLRKRHLLLCPRSSASAAPTVNSRLHLPASQAEASVPAAAGYGG